MKILIINSSTLPYPPVFGGAVENLIDLYVKKYMNNKEYEITIVSKYEKRAFEESKNYKNVKFVWIKTNTIKYKFIRYFSALLRKITHKYIDNAYIFFVKKQINDFEKYDIVISENVSEYGLALRKLVKGKLVLHLHNDILNKNTIESKKILSVYDELWCLSKYIKSKVDEIEKCNKTKLLYNGIDIERFNIRYNQDIIYETRKKYNIKNEDKVIMYSGRIVPEKGVLELVKAFNQIKKDNVKLLLVGNIEGKEKYKKIIKREIRENSNIIVTGYVNYECIPKLYSIADLGIVPSMWEEPFALTVVEFMASKTPLVVTDSGAITELVNEKYASIVKRDKNIISNIRNSIIDGLEKKYDYGKMNEDIFKFSSDKYCQKIEMYIRELMRGEG